MCMVLSKLFKGIEDKTITSEEFLKLYYSLSPKEKDTFLMSKYSRIIFSPDEYDNFHFRTKRKCHSNG